MIREYVDQIYSNDPDYDGEGVSLSLRINADQTRTEEKLIALEAIVKERNTLIHKKLAGLDESSVESCRELGDYLDEQADRIKPHYDELRMMLDVMRAGSSLIATIRSGPSKDRDV